MILRFLLIPALYFVEMSILKSTGPLNFLTESPYLRATLSIGLGLLLLIGPFVVGSTILHVARQRTIERLARAWCAENGKAFVTTRSYKSHYAVIYTDKGAKQRVNLRYSEGWLPWQPGRVEWHNS